jgi:Histidine kinase-, DNA gyrase B-, and HSP90-like ATPase
MKTLPLVAVASFIEATRDTGYKSTGAAIAELIDNSLEAQAKRVDVSIQEVTIDGKAELNIRVTDDGEGMCPDVLRVALQFGGSTRFGSRNGTGRYGMGLPNGGLSQARRLEVFTWTKRSEIWRSHLDVDEITSGSMDRIPTPRLAEGSKSPRTPSGTMIVLSKCDRVECKNVETLELTLAIEFGRTFRKFLQAGRIITVNGGIVRPVDPLFVAPGAIATGAKLYGAAIAYKLRVPEAAMTNGPTSTVSVTFSELPIEKWHDLSNEKKNGLGISKGAGVSIVRAGREIDFGWYFMGSKRKENYDDWWRCEVNFSPDLDELFGVTHSKQKINPTELLSSILTPEVERIARELNNRVRRKYSNIKSATTSSGTLRRFQARDHLLEPPRRLRSSGTQAENAPELRLLRKRNDGVNGLTFSLSHKPEEHNCFFDARLRKGVLSIDINECHPFYSALYKHLGANGPKDGANQIEYVLLLLISFARAECVLSRGKDREIMRRLRQVWSDTVAAFLS